LRPNDDPSDLLRRLEKSPALDEKLTIARGEASCLQLAIRLLQKGDERGRRDLVGGHPRFIEHDPHLAPLAATRRRLLLLLSSVESLDNLRTTLPASAWARLAAGAVVASSPRVADAARRAGLRVATVAASAVSRDLLAAAALAAR